MNIKFLRVKGTWREIANSANTTIGVDAGEKEPPSLWKRRMLLSEHSPIRQLIFKAKWYDIKYWVSVHFVRHWLGIVHWISSQRPDRLTGVKSNRDDAPQATLVIHEFEVNAQAIISISRKRLCKGNPMPETREAWQAFVDSFKDIQPEMHAVCVPDCIYRGWCYEYKSCGFHKTKEYKEALREYREGINQ